MRINRGKMLAWLAVGATAAVPAPLAAGTPAGTVISNVARVDYSVAGRALSGESNEVRFVVVGDAALPTLVKSATVDAPGGPGGRGALITYRLIAEFPAAVRGAAVADPIPAGTRYRPGSLLLDGLALTDAADGDPGEAATGRVAVALGDQPAAARRAIQFQVEVIEEE